MQNNPRNQVRIIGGELRRRVLHFPDTAGLRPTPDRVRETLFNWLGQDMTGVTCLDAFAGSGALGFEAASRNAARVVMLETARPALDALKKNQQTLRAVNVEILAADASGWMGHCREAFDIIFLDPPFSSGLMPEVLALAARLIKPEGWIYVEQGEKPEAPEGFIIHREGKAGLSHFALLKRT